MFPEPEEEEPPVDDPDEVDFEDAVLSENAEFEGPEDEIAEKPEELLELDGEDDAPSFVLTCEVGLEVGIPMLTDVEPDG